MIIRYLHLLLISILITSGCNGDNTEDDINREDQNKEVNIDQFADVTAIVATGNTGSYTFSVTISSPDTGCQQYADYWEVVSLEGELLYRRILLHSHVSEQPFRRSGGPIEITENQVVWIRAHMNNSGYGGVAMKGSVESGFNREAPPSGFADNLAFEEPLPDDCQF